MTPLAPVRWLWQHAGPVRWLWERQRPTWHNGVTYLCEAVGAPPPPCSGWSAGPKVPAASLAALAVLAIGPSAYKTAAIIGCYWHEEVALGLAVAATAIVFLLVGGRDAPHDRLVALGLRRSRDPEGPQTPAFWTVAPLTLALLGTAVYLGFEGRAPRIDGKEIASLIVYTAVAEELLFRGALLALAHRVLCPRWASAVVAGSFALWHVGNGMTDEIGAGDSRALHVLSVVIGTAIASYVFTWARLRSRSLLGSVFAHLTTNLPGTLAAKAAQLPAACSFDAGTVVVGIVASEPAARS